MRLILIIFLIIFALGCTDVIPDVDLSADETTAVSRGYKVVCVRKEWRQVINWDHWPYPKSNREYVCVEFETVQCDTCGYY